jgi:hypothetical protein
MSKLELGRWTRSEAVDEAASPAVRRNLELVRGRFFVRPTLFSERVAAEPAVDKMCQMRCVLVQRRAGFNLTRSRGCAFAIATNGTGNRRVREILVTTVPNGQHTKTSAGEAHSEKFLGPPTGEVGRIALESCIDASP